MPKFQISSSESNSRRELNNHGNKLGLPEVALGGPWVLTVAALNRQTVDSVAVIDLLDADKAPVARLHVSEDDVTRRYDGRLEDADFEFDMSFEEALSAAGFNGAQDGKPLVEAFDFWYLVLRLRQGLYL